MACISPRFLIVAFSILVVGAAPLHAAESSAVGGAEFHLAIGEADGFRLGKLADYAPAPEVALEPGISPELAEKPYSSLIHKAARDAALDPVLVHAVIAVESGYNAKALSPKGAIGLMQVLPETAKRYGVPDPGHSPEANLKAGTRYLRDLMQQFAGRLELVLAAYNAGEKAVLHYGGRIPPYAETLNYVPEVLSRYHVWKPQPRAPGAAPIVYIQGTRLEPHAD